MKWLNTSNELTESEKPQEFSVEALGSTPADVAVPREPAAVPREPAISREPIGAHAACEPEKVATETRGISRDAFETTVSEKRAVKKTLEGTAEESRAVKPAVRDQDMAISRKQWRHLLTLGLMNLCVYLSYQGVFDRISHLMGRAAIENLNQQYLTRASEDCEALFEILSVSKMVLAVLQSGSGGVDFIVNVQVGLGQSLRVLFDAIDQAWQFSWVTLVSIEALKVLLDVSTHITAPVWTGLFVFLGVSMALQQSIPVFGDRIKKLAKSLFVFALVLNLFLPLSVSCAALLNQHFFAAHKAQVHEGFRQVHEALPQYNDHAQMKDTIKHSMMQVHSSAHDLHQHSKKVMQLTTKHMVLSTFEYILFPLLIVWGTVTIMRRMLF